MLAIFITLATLAFIYGITKGIKEARGKSREQLQFENRQRKEAKQESKRRKQMQLPKYGPTKAVGDVAGTALFGVAWVGGRALNSRRKRKKRQELRSEQQLIELKRLRKQIEDGHN